MRPPKTKNVCQFAVFAGWEVSQFGTFTQERKIGLHSLIQILVLGRVQLLYLDNPCHVIKLINILAVAK